MTVRGGAGYLFPENDETIDTPKSSVEIAPLDPRSLTHVFLVGDLTAVERLTVIHDQRPVEILYFRFTWNFAWVRWYVFRYPASIVLLSIIGLATALFILGGILTRVVRWRPSKAIGAPLNDVSIVKLNVTMSEPIGERGSNAAVDVAVPDDAGR